mmetsp:Transcript_131866/g.239772  ORF Transcript_131866/g.239772 Transcript_131866/m.239772 type:complete len:375 (-) Transcript_131866:54-1178(-)
MLQPGRLLGFLMLTGTIFLWVASSVAVQMIFEGVHFEKPVFVTLFNSASSVSLLLPRLLRPCGRNIAMCSTACSESHAQSQQDKTSLSCMLHLSATIGLLWLCAQWIFNWSLLYTSVATNTVLSSTTSVFTFFFSLVICRDPFRWCSFGAALSSFFGCLLVSMQKPSKITATAVNSSVLGDVLTLTSAAMFSLASVMLRKLAPSKFDSSFFMGMNGLLAIVMSPMVLYAAHHLGVENFRPPTGNVLLALSVNAVLGCACANYLYISALLLLSPLVTSVCMSLSIPISALTDEVLMRQHRFSSEWLLGAALVSAGVIFAAFDLEPVASPSSSKAKGEWAEAAELESLLENQEGSELQGREKDFAGRRALMISRRA